jgi:hypothetical protein
MADLGAFIDHNRDLIATAQKFTEDGFVQEQVYRQYLPQVKDPKFPCITLSFEKDQEEVFAGISTGMFYVSVYTKQFSKTQDTTTWITDLLHGYTYSNGSLVIYKCLEKSSPPSPSYDKETETWETVQGFEVSFG